MRPIQQAIILLQLSLGIIVVSISCFAVFAEANVKACTNLPRIEAQFLCNGPVLDEHFNATKIFEDYFTNEVFVEKNDSSRKPYQLQLYVSASRSIARDISSSEWYYQRCDPWSTETLVSIDVRGYYDWEEENETNKTTFRHDDLALFETFSEYPQTNDLESYLSSKVCWGRPLDFYRARIREWNELDHPIGSEYKSKKCSLPAHQTASTNRFSSDRAGGFLSYPSSSILNENGSKEVRQPQHEKMIYNYEYESRVHEDGYTYDHDLYLLCGGAVDSHTFYGSANDEDVLPSPFFLLIGVLFGYVMVYMIKVEFNRPLRYQQLPMSRYPRNNTSSSSTNSMNSTDDIGDDSESGGGDHGNGNVGNTSNNDNGNYGDGDTDGDTDGDDDDDNRRQEIELVMI